MTDSRTFAPRYLAEVAAIASALDPTRIDELVAALYALKQRRGRLFVVGVGGSAANASHAATDFRRLAGVQAYAFDNLSELSARTNDQGWTETTRAWLEDCRFSSSDALLVLSVGGGAPGVSENLILAITLAMQRDAPVFAIIGDAGGYAAQHASIAVVVPCLYPAHLTPHAESFQSVVWHLLVSHPLLKESEPTWETLRAV